MEIEINPRSAWWLVVLVALVGLVGLGVWFSPRATDGRPVLMLPDVRAVEIYRRDASGWAGEWRTLDENIRQTLEAPDTELLQRSRQAQAAFDQAVDLARRVDGQDAPASLVGLRDLAIATSSNYVNATVAVNQWLSAPTAENLAAAQSQFAVAQQSLMDLESNQWLARSVSGTEVPVVASPAP